MVTLYTGVCLVNGEVGRFYRELVNFPRDIVVLTDLWNNNNLTQLRITIYEERWPSRGKHYCKKSGY